MTPGKRWEDLATKLTDARRKRLEEAATRRTDFIRLVVQDIHHPHNVSACLRSAEAFGVLNVDVVTLREKFSPSTVTQGVASWLRIHRHESIDNCVKELRKSGYRIAIGVPLASAQYTLPNIPVEAPMAVVFGNEKQGISPEWHQHADFTFTIPMDGLVESLNISVSAAVTLFQLTQKAKAQVPAERYFLSKEARGRLLDSWCDNHSVR